jgi:hypothetical protein
VPVTRKRAAANATGNALSNAASNIGGYAAYKGLYGSNGSSNPSMMVVLLVRTMLL